MPERFLIVGPCRSGTTMFLRSVKNHPNAMIEFQTIKTGQRQQGAPDYSFFQRPVPDDKFLVNKETIGYATDEDCTLQVFPNDEAIRATRPVFIFRKPRDTFVSWIENDLVDADQTTHLFIQAYRHTFELLMHARTASEHASALSYEVLCTNPQQKLQTVCNKWDIEFHPHMIDWQDQFIETTPLDRDGIDQGHYRTVSTSSSIASQKPKSGLSQSQAKEIDQELEEIYEKIMRLVL